MINIGTWQWQSFVFDYISLAVLYLKHLSSTFMILSNLLQIQFSVIIVVLDWDTVLGTLGRLRCNFYYVWRIGMQLLFKFRNHLRIHFSVIILVLGWNAVLGTFGRLKYNFCYVWRVEKLLSLEIWDVFLLSLE